MAEDRSACKYRPTIFITSPTYIDFAPRTREQPERIREIDRIAARKPVQVEPTRQPDGVFLGELSGGGIILLDSA
jgi:hypothetical protein